MENKMETTIVRHGGNGDSQMNVVACFVAHSSSSARDNGSK